MTPNPLAWLRHHGFADRIPVDDKEGWEWLRQHSDDPDVEKALDQMPSGVRKTDE